MPKGCKADAVPETRVQEVRRKLKDIIEARGPDDDDDEIGRQVATTPPTPHGRICGAGTTTPPPTGGGTTTPPPAQTTSGWELVEANDFNTGSQIDQNRFYIKQGFKGTNSTGDFGNRDRFSLILTMTHSTLEGADQWNPNDPQTIHATYTSPVGRFLGASGALLHLSSALGTMTLR